MIVEDRLSMLPEEIILYILSLMPINFAMRTSILSKRWRYTWMVVENLDFDDAHDLMFREDILKQIVTQFVDRVLKFRRTSQVKLFRLHINKSWVQKSIISRWIDEAVKLNVRELDINVNDLKLPLSMFTCKKLTKLRLDCQYRYQEWPSSVIYLPSLKSLDIVDYYNHPFADVFKLINGCPMLESLSLEIYSCGKENYIFNIPTLKRLKLTLGDRSMSLMSKVVLNVPNLEYLFATGIWCSILMVENVSREACFSIDGITYDVDHLNRIDDDLTFFSEEDFW